MTTTRRVCLLLILAAVVYGKDHQWVNGTVIAVENVQQHWLAGKPAAVEYTIRIDTAEYILEDVVKSYLNAPPKELLTTGTTIQVALDGKAHMIIRAPSGDRRLRIARTRRAVN